MPFRTSLVVSIDGLDYILTRPLRYVARNGGVIVVPMGFRTDFASIPNILRPIFTGHDRTRKAAVLHDYLYQHGIGKRKDADKLFLAAMEESGVPMWKRYAMYWGVRIGGWASWSA